ncbi:MULTISPECIES: hypothetical protein [unclassified Dyella]|jgi:preprotein translocase subunit SecD|uniref:hypothetical protein n=1 Tax=unclassified Dyella TaxID=2634549 RepID=UPI003F90E692
MRKRFWLSLSFCLPGLILAATGTNEAVRTSTHKFAPVTFSLGCGQATRNEDKRDLTRSSLAVGYFQQTECVDAARQLSAAKLVAVAITENEKLGLFEVVLKLDPASALSLSKLTAHGNPQQLVLSVKGQAVVAGFNEAPFHGDKFSITADTIDDARRTADLFDE